MIIPKELMQNKSSVEEGMARVSQMLDMLLEVGFCIGLCVCLFVLFVCLFYLIPYISPATILCCDQGRTESQRR